MKTSHQLSSFLPANNQLLTKKLLFIYAHPDDESLLSGGSIAIANQEDIPVGLICLTNGDLGTLNPDNSNLATLRRHELKQAASILGISYLKHLNFPDGKSYLSYKQICQKLVDLIAEYKPTDIITHDPSGITNHPDHITTSLAVFSAAKQLKIPTQLWFSLKDSLVETDKILLNMPRPTHQQNILNTAATKAEACLCHQSQQLHLSKSVPLKIWFSLQNIEYFHQVTKNHKYIYQYYPYKYGKLNFNPTDLPAIILKNTTMEL